ncbi:hypothetical protein VNI00_004407 [Paramarasmius palmivorus]|uniref:NmrA-like domain-containing protein n=1 Tax=Paramarasmius palmivorus TaxID=297713 RepID=A0AAW0DQB2_9AGAR
MASKKLILVVGATGAQGLPVVNSLLAPSKDGTPSPYAVRALTRDPTSERALQLKAAGVELFKGSFEDTKDIIEAYKGCYGAFINTDTFSVGLKREIYAAIQLYEYSHREESMRHFIWSGLDYSSKLGNYQLKYKAEHLDSKGIFNDFLKMQPSAPVGDSFTWSIVTTGPYIEGLRGALLGPLEERENGAVVFATPIGDGHVPVISLRDIGWWVRWTFDNREETSGKEIKIATEMLHWDTLVETFTRVTGIPAIHRRLGVDEYMAKRGLDKIPLIAGGGKDLPTIKDTFSGMYWSWRDDLLTRDMEWLRKIHPEGHTLESWIRETGYDGTRGKSVLKSDYQL